MAELSSSYTPGNESGKDFYLIDNIFHVVNFKVGGVSLSGAHKKGIDKIIIPWLVKTIASVGRPDLYILRAGGHASFTGDPEKNKRLSEERALSLTNYIA